MSSNAPSLAFPTRVNRFAVSLACQFGDDDANFIGTVVNVSCAGLGIELKNNINKIDLRAPYTVVVDGLGEFNVKIRWNRRSRIGVTFSDSDTSKVLVQEYLETRELALT